MRFRERGHGREEEKAGDEGERKDRARITELVSFLIVLRQEAC